MFEKTEMQNLRKVENVMTKQEATISVYNHINSQLIKYAHDAERAIQRNDNAGYLLAKFEYRLTLKSLIRFCLTPEESLQEELQEWAIKDSQRNAFPAWREPEPKTAITFSDGETLYVEDVPF